VIDEYVENGYHYKKKAIAHPPYIENGEVHIKLGFKFVFGNDFVVAKGTTNNCHRIFTITAHLNQQ
jgi:hypothetical protein